MPIFPNRPEPGDILRLYDQQKMFHGNAHRKMEQAQALYDHQFSELSKDLPEGLSIHAPSTASSIIDHFRDNVRVNRLIPERDEFGTSKAARERLALLLRIDNWVIQHIRHDSVIDPFVQTIFDMSLRGAAAWRVYFDQSKYTEPTDPDERRVWLAEKGIVLPFEVRPIDPLTVYPAPGGKWPMEWVIERQTRAAWEVMSRYPSWQNSQNKQPTDNVDWLEFFSAPYWDEGGAFHPGWYIVLADGDEVIGMENPFGAVPYVFEYSGMGRIDYTNDPASLAVNMLEKAESELQAEARIKTAMDAMIQYTAWPRLMTTEDPRELKVRWDMGPAGILQVRGMDAEQRPQWMEQPELPTGLFNFLPLVRQGIERATFSSVLEGQRTPGVDFGYLQSLLVGQASLRKDNIIGMSSRLFARGVGLIERIMTHLELGPFTLGPGTEGEPGRTFDPKRHIGNKYDLRVVIEASDPAERDRKMLAWLSPLRAGVISHRTYLKEGLMMDDPDEEIAQIHAEMVVNQLVQSGTIAQSVLQDVQQQAGNANLEGMVEERLGQVRANVPGTPPVEESPVSPSPFSVVKKMQSVNQRATSLEKRA